MLTYKPQLGGLRALAVTLVIVSHTWTGGGHRGVQLFFVLSGLLITSILLDEAESIRRGERSPSEALFTFYWRRLIRIAPPYYLVLLVCVVVPGLKGRDGFLYHLLFVSNFRFFSIEAWRPAALAPMWSLAVEQQFYAFWPLVVLFVRKSQVLMASVVMIALAVVARWLVFSWGWEEETVVGLPPLPFDALGFGALLAVCYGRFALRRLLELAAAVAMLVALSVAWEWWPQVPDFGSQIEEVCWCLAFAGLLSHVLRKDNWLVRALSLKALVSVGRVSYAMYLVHIAVFLSLKAVGSRWGGFRWWPSPLSFAAVFFLSLFLALAMWQCVERPLSELKKRPPAWRQKRSRQLPGTSE